MGYGLGAAIGAKCGNPDKTVVNIAGDGSFHMNLNELVTLSKHNIPVVELVITFSVWFVSGRDCSTARDFHRRRLTVLQII